jgi:hypothetical protein
MAVMIRWFRFLIISPFESLDFRITSPHILSFTLHHVVSHRSEFLPFEHESVEMAQTKQNSLHLGISIFVVLLSEQRKRSLQVRLETLRRLVRQLDGSLEET